jgi:hypothetical protein
MEQRSERRVGAKQVRVGVREVGGGTLHQLRPEHVEPRPAAEVHAELGGIERAPRGVPGHGAEHQVLAVYELLTTQLHAHPVGGDGDEALVQPERRVREVGARGPRPRGLRLDARREPHASQLDGREDEREAKAKADEVVVREAELVVARAHLGTGEGVEPPVERPRRGRGGLLRWRLARCRLLLRHGRSVRLRWGLGIARANRVALCGRGRGVRWRCAGRLRPRRPRGAQQQRRDQRRHPHELPWHGAARAHDGVAPHLTVERIAHLDGPHGAGLERAHGVVQRPRALFGVDRGSGLGAHLEGSIERPQVIEVGVEGGLVERGAVHVGELAELHGVVLFEGISGSTRMAGLGAGHAGSHAPQPVQRSPSTTG